MATGCVKIVKKSSEFDEEGKFIHRLFDDNCENQFGCSIMVFSDPAQLPDIVSGCTVSLSSNGDLLQYLTTSS